MLDKEVRQELETIARKSMGRLSASKIKVVEAFDLDDGSRLDIAITLKQESPQMSGRAYSDILVRAHDYLRSKGDMRNVSIRIDRLSATEKVDV